MKVTTQLGICLLLLRLLLEVRALDEYLLQRNTDKTEPVPVIAVGNDHLPCNLLTLATLNFGKQTDYFQIIWNGRSFGWMKRPFLTSPPRYTSKMPMTCCPVQYLPQRLSVLPVST